MCISSECMDVADSVKHDEIIRQIGTDGNGQVGQRMSTAMINLRRRPATKFGQKAFFQ